MALHAFLPNFFLRWSLHPFHHAPRPLSAIYHPPTFPIPNNITSAAGNTYKNIYEATTMSSGLVFVIFANIITFSIGILFYRYVLLRNIGILTPEEIRLLRKYPSVRPTHSYTPTESLTRAAPPMRWNGWRSFFTSSESLLSRDAQVYLLFQRACIVTIFICAIAASIFLFPSYWLGGDVLRGPTSKNTPNTLLSLLKSDRGIFERLTSHNLPSDSPLVMLQLPVFVVVALCIIALYSVVHAAAGESYSVDEWLRSTPSSSLASMPLLPDGSPQPVAQQRQWTVFARGLPRDIASADDLSNLLNAIYPSEVIRVELICRGKVSEARLLRALATARHRLDYLYQISHDPEVSCYTPQSSLLAAIFSMFARRRTRSEMIATLEERIATLQSDFESRKAEPVRDFLGCAFITFRSPSAAGSALKDFPVSIKRRPPELRIPDDTATGRPLPQSMIGRHARMQSDLNVSGLRNLYRGTVNLLPEFLRARVLSSSNLAPLDASDGSSNSTHINVLDCIALREAAIAKLRNMKAERAPKSGDIIWRNIGISFLERTVREIVVQVLVFSFLILFTSPVAMMTAFRLVFSELAVLKDPQLLFANTHNGPLPVSSGTFNESEGLTFFSNLGAGGGATVEAISKDLLGVLPSFLSQNGFLTAAILAYIPVFLLAIVFAIVPSLLRLTCSMEGYPTRSALEMSVFRKTSFYYVMNAVVLPSFALNTASQFLEMLYKQSGGGANVYNALPILQRLFSGDIAYFLCSYLVQLGLTGSVFWLMRIPSSISMIFRRRMALTPLEIAESKCADIFDYPRHYAYNVTVMSMVLLFGFMAPPIWYFALFYFVCKHAVDCYTLRYVHPRTHIDGRLPRLSANFILIWTTVSQLSLAVIFYLQGWVRAGILTGLLCILTIAGCLSASSMVGNRVLSVIANLRDRAVNRIMTLAGSRYSLVWSPPPSSVMSSNSSANSLPESHESDTLLLQDPVSRRISLEIDGLSELRTSAVMTNQISEMEAETTGAFRNEHATKNERGSAMDQDVTSGVGSSSTTGHQTTGEIGSSRLTLDNIEEGGAPADHGYGTCAPTLRVSPWSSPGA